MDGWRNDSLHEYYRSVAIVHGVTAIIAKMSLAVALWLVAAGNQKPGYRLLTGVFLCHFLTASLLAVGSTWYAAPVLMVALAMAAAAAYSLVKEPEVAWIPVPDSEIWRPLAWIGYAVAMFLPLWTIRSLGRPIVYSPIGILPHQTLLALLILSASSGNVGSRVIRIAVAPATIVLGLVDVFMGDRIIGIVLLVASAAYIASRLIPGLRMVEFSAEEPDEPKRQDAERKTSGKKWNIK